MDLFQRAENEKEGEEFRRKIDEIYGYEAEKQKSGQEGESFFSKFMKYLQEMRNRQNQRAQVQMRKMID